MNTQTLRAHPMMVIAATSVTIFALVGSAAVLGWLPTSHGEEATAQKTEQKAEKDSREGKEAKEPAKHGTRLAAKEESRRHGDTKVASICESCGVVKSVNLIEQKGEGTGLGAVAGGVAGGLLGNMVGKGDGKTVATVAGVAGGAYAGHQVEKTVRSTKYYDVAVKMEDGSVRHFHQNTNPGLEVGQRVKIVDGAIQQQS